MTRYEQGFLNKCAEYGVDIGTSVKLMKEAMAKSALSKVKFSPIDKAMRTAAMGTGPARDKALAFLKGKGHTPTYSRTAGGRKVMGFAVPKKPAPPKKPM